MDSRPEPRQLALVSQARKALAEASTLDEVKDIRDKAEAMRLYLRQRDESLEAQNTAAEIKLWAERKAGELLTMMPKHPAGRRTINRSHDVTDLPPTLEEIGIGKMESSRWQAIASVPEDEFVNLIEETKGAEQPLTTNGVLNYARERIETPEKSPEEIAARLLDRQRTHFLKCLAEIDDLTRAVDAPDKHGGYGGLRVVLDLIGRKALPAVMGTTEDMIERLQDWLTEMTEYLNESNRIP